MHLASCAHVLFEFMLSRFSSFFFFFLFLLPVAVRLGPLSGPCWVRAISFCPPLTDCKFSLDAQWVRVTTCRPPLVSFFWSIRGAGEISSPPRIVAANLPFRWVCANSFRPPLVSFFWSIRSAGETSSPPRIPAAYLHVQVGARELFSPPPSVSSCIFQSLSCRYVRVNLELGPVV